MALTLETPPPSLAALMLDSVLDHLSRTVETGESPTPTDPDQNYILALSEAAVGLLDGPDGKIGRCLLEQAWKLTIDHAFPPIINITLPPIVSVDSVRYYDTDGALQTLASSSYRVTGTGSWLAEIAPAYGESWPAVRWQSATVEVAFTAGYGDELSDVPAPILQAIRELVGHWYENRYAAERGALVEIPFGVKQLIAPYRVFR